MSGLLPLGGCPFGDSRLPLRFWQKVVLTEAGCWEWTGARDRHGYAQFNIGARTTNLAHRVSYSALVGPITRPELDHLCRNILCVNVAHLEPVTRAENIRRRYALQTHCRNGHEFTPENTYIKPAHRRQGVRDCRACGRDRAARYKLRQRARSAVSS